jgi:L-ascorbate metabolism protein UlaG (beta-lactamase superfamily)
MELGIGAFRLLTDPMFGTGAQAFVMHGHPNTGEAEAPVARLAELPEMNLGGLDGVVISHLHTDHFDPSAEERLPHGTRMIAPLNQALQLVDQHFRDTEGLEWWQSLDLEKRGELLRITAVPARHSHDDVQNDRLGTGNGYLFEYSCDLGLCFRMYWTGDTVWFDGMRDIYTRAGQLDLLVPHLGAVGLGGPYGMMTLDSSEAVQVIELFQPRTIVPIHHHTFSHYVEPVSALQDRLRGTPFQDRLVVLQEGEQIVMA